MEVETDQLRENVITQGRAVVRIIEAADVLLDRHPVWTERLLLRLGMYAPTGYPARDARPPVLHQQKAPNRNGSGL